MQSGSSLLVFETFHLSRGSAVSVHSPEGVTRRVSFSGPTTPIFPQTDVFRPVGSGVFYSPSNDSSNDGDGVNFLIFRRGGSRQTEGCFVTSSFVPSAVVIIRKY